MQDFECFVCDGGPHILLPVSVRSLWRGLGENYDPSDGTTDYARACIVPPPAGLISVGQEQALVLAGSPPMTAWNTSLHKGALNIYVLDSWNTPDVNDLLHSAFDEIEITKLKDTGIRWNISDDLVVMFAGDRAGAAAYGEATLPRLTGQYAIYEGRYEGEMGALSLVRLVPQGS